MEALNKFGDYFNWAEIKKSVDLDDPLVYACLAHVVFNPLFWNVIARLEFKTHFGTKLFGGNSKIACSVSAVIIFLLGITRDLLYFVVIRRQPDFTPLENMFEWQYTGLCVNIFSGLLLAWGITLVASAYIRLGIIGTYLGDYFGMLLPGKIEGFPFNITSCPMYDGSSINFLAFAVYERSIVGACISLLVFIAYRVACIFEDSFTEQIYAEAAPKKTN